MMARAATPDPDRRMPDQPPIQDYALIGDCHGSALVSRAGSIDWCALLRFDADPVFFRLLDAKGGGCWDIQGDDLAWEARDYVGDSNVLCTRFRTATGEFTVTDYMPVGRSRDASAHDYVSLNAPGWLVRRFCCTNGSVRFTIRFLPRSGDFSTEPMPLSLADGRIVCPGGLSLWHGGAARITGDGACVDYELRAGQTEDAILAMVEPMVDPRRWADRLLQTTLSFWREWIEYSRYRGPYQKAVTRSALALKLLTYAPTGALIAAPTTSLPESIGGERNWDYRFCWLRDASFALYSLSAIGYSGETRRFSDFLSRRCFREGSAIRIMYGIQGEPFLPERQLDHLAGFQGSQPVRTGNAASEQLQLDVFGEIFDWADLRVALGARLSKDERAHLACVADHVSNCWRQPDQGLWEVRSGARNFVHGKAMAWVALERAARLLGDRDHWRRQREEILAALRADGCRGTPAYMTQSFESEGTDATLLTLPLLGLPIDRKILAETVRRIEQELQSGPFVYRYRSEDGLEGPEGALFITSFWLVDALLAVDRAAEARDLFEQLLGYANDVGLYSEEIDPGSKAFLGNFPQAFTHLALISSATLLDLYEQEGANGLRGTHADRARRLVGATAGAKALAYALIRNGKVRLRSSAQSILDLR